MELKYHFEFFFSYFLGRVFKFANKKKKKTRRLDLQARMLLYRFLLLLSGWSDVSEVIAMFALRACTSFPQNK